MRKGFFKLACARPGAAVVAIGMLALISHAGAAVPAFQGQGVAGLLAAARSDGLVVIFNTRLVPESLRVTREPAARSGQPLLEEILAQHGLALAPMNGGVFAVVRRGAAAPVAAAAASAVVPLMLDEIVVTTSRYAFGTDVAGSHSLLDSDAIATMPRLGDETLRAVQRLPGVAGNGYSGLSPVRGGEPQETLILLDGMVLYEPFHLKNFLSPVSLLDSRFIGGLDFYSGGFAARFGDRMSAVIDAHSLARPIGHRHELGLSLFHVNGLASGGFGDGRGTWLASLRQSNLGRMLDAIESDYGNPEYADGFGRIDYAWSDATDLSFHVLGSRDDIELNWDRAGETVRAGYRNAYVWATVDHRWSDTLSGRWIVSYTNINNDRAGVVADPGRREGSVSDRRHFDMAALNLDFRWEGFHGVHEWGGELRQLSAEYRYASRVRFEPSVLYPSLAATDTSRALAVSPDGWKLGAFWSSRVPIGDRLVAEAGLRIEDERYVGPEHSVQVSPRASLLYAFSAATRVRASWGQFSQSQQINELELEDGIDTFRPAQHATHAVLSVDHTLSPGVILRAEAYRKVYSQLKERSENLFDPLVLLPELQPDRVRIAPAAAIMKGIELSLTWQPPGAWSGWFSYVWSEAADTVDGRRVLRSWDQKHAISAGVRWSSGPWDVTLADTWHSGWPTTAVALQTVAGQTTAIFGPRNGERFEDYNALDLRVSRRFPLPRGELEAYVEVSNLANAGNECCVDYRVITPAQGPPDLDARVHNWLGVVPSLGVLWKY